MHGGVGEEADALDAEIGEDLAAEADGAEDASAAGLGAFAGAQFLMEDEATGIERSGAGGCSGAFGAKCRRERIRGRVVDGKAARSVVEVEDDATAFFGDHAHGLIEDLAAMAVGGEDVAGRAAGVDADEHGMRAGWTEVERGGCEVGRMWYPRSQNRDLGHPRLR